MESEDVSIKFSFLTILKLVFVGLTVSSSRLVVSLPKLLSVVLERYNQRVYHHSNCVMVGSVDSQQGGGASEGEGGA